MAGESLERVGLHLDDKNQLRILESDAQSASGRLIAESTGFVEHSTAFQSVVGDFAAIIDNLAKEVEKAKIKALGSRNELKSIALERQNERQQLEIQLDERRCELERLRTQLQSLQRLETQQQSFIDTLTHHSL